MKVGLQLTGAPAGWYGVPPLGQTAEETKKFTFLYDLIVSRRLHVAPPLQQ